MKKAILLFMTLLCMSLVFAEIQTVEVTFLHQHVLAEGSHQIYSIENNQYEIEIIKLDPVTKKISAKINNEKKEFDFSQQTQIDYFDYENNIQIQFYSDKIVGSGTPLIHFTFMKSYSAPNKSSPDSDLSLKDFPSKFDSKSDFVLIIGKYSDIDKTIAGIELLKYLNIITEYGQIVNSENGKSVTVPIIPTGRANLDIAVKLGTGDYFVIGGPCANKLADDLLGNPNDCTVGFKDGEAIIQLFKTQDSHALLIAGYSAYDTQRAVEFLKTNPVMTEDKIIINTTTLEII